MASLEARLIGQMSCSSIFAVGQRYLVSVNYENGICREFAVIGPQEFLRWKSSSAIGYQALSEE